MRCPGRFSVIMVAVALLLGGMPLTLGMVVHSSEAMFTLDICHSGQSFGHSPVSVVAIIPDPPAVAQFLPECGQYPLPVSGLGERAADVPDPPPPKARA